VISISIFFGSLSLLSLSLSLSYTYTHILEQWTPACFSHHHHTPTNEQNPYPLFSFVCYILSIFMFLLFLSLILRFYSSLEQKKRDRHVSIFFFPVMIYLFIHDHHNFSLKWGFLFFSFWTLISSSDRNKCKTTAKPRIIMALKQSVSDCYNEDHFGYMG
jgi:hypothetical protein